jgi:hypothetical protein
MGFAALTPHPTIPEKNLLTHVTRIFQKRLFTETTPAARAGDRAGLFAARTQTAAARGVFSCEYRKG